MIGQFEWLARDAELLLPQAVNAFPPHSVCANESPAITQDTLARLI